MTNLTAKKRDELGSRWARRLRADGRIPCSIQGGATGQIHASIDSHEFLSARRHHVHLFDIDVEGSTETAVVRELQWDAFGEEIAHVEFLRVVRGQAIEATVALEFTGHPKDGILNHVMSEIVVRTLPSQIPDSIEVRVDGLEIGHPLHAGDIELPEGVELAEEPDEVVAVVVAARGIEEPEEAEVEEMAASEVPKVSDEEAAEKEETEG